MRERKNNLRKERVGARLALRHLLPGCVSRGAVHGGSWRWGEDGGSAPRGGGGNSASGVEASERTGARTSISEPEQEVAGLGCVSEADRRDEEPPKP